MLMILEVFCLLEPILRCICFIKGMHALQSAVLFFEFLTVGHERLRDFQIEKHAFEDVNRKKKSGESGI